ncbi:tRNA (adenosine(37)-N6)-threonylcarbamoyltransferase complex dimerization subunit type 1 TsaB [Gordonia sp. PDNC005]|uniref:tRNA (adenosine(37)-N6)-threonylcarbamoyltransferase complex dimerization subunit type 1 TsaB n=1 Tax=unclassified Gordonia (in: high G+C Gram-positive bacteria) TaxID=2657482 RepID=UPI0019646AC9|nr:tRNA (adenosine(37)-N6)-threonylcarbamoyltransferase complex dimerization subunit type 1 TsaB [Gordonia sp. PDNC005]QRY63392.1 tRNA (adenosine(37)-N6)-threonylcarbamoyltransferase complex dimerization subunit type 1 TsaB [Gordonia sp. PDNC005]
MTTAGDPVRVLAIDTATEAVVTGVVSVAGDTITTLAERSITENRRHAEILTTLIREVLDEAGLAGSDLDAVVVGAGPGPFTGLRVGMATASAYADALGLPVHGVCSLDGIAVDAALDGETLVVTDARRREVYWARYRGAERIDGPGVLAPAALETGGATIVGPQRLLETIDHTDSRELIAPTAAGIVTALSTRQLAQGAEDESKSEADQLCSLSELASRKATHALEPLYLRRPDAVELKDQRRKSLLPVTGGE